MTIPYFHVDAFTGPDLRGNPAGVCLLEQWLPDTVLQNIANENNLSETAFLVRRETDWHLRWFTPTVEVDLCGHATLASAYVLTQVARAAKGEVRFHSKSGILTVTCENDLMTLDFPSRPPQPTPPVPELEAGLGCRAVEVSKARDYLVVLESEADVRSLRPDMARLEKIDVHATIVSAPGDKCDFVSRFFAPRVGVPEDPVTGSAHCTLIPYWSRRLGKDKLRAIQISRRGGELFCENRGDRVGIGGRALLYSRGEIDVQNWI